DDEPNVLAGYVRHLRRGFNVETASGGPEALQLVQGRPPYAVIISDLKMPEMDGIQLLSRVKSISPDTVRMMLTGFADMQNAVAAVNEGNIFRFLTKPCPMEILARAIVDGIKQYRLVTAEHELLEKTLAGCIKVLTDILSMLNPQALGRASRIQRLVLDIGRHMGLDDLWALGTAALLSQIGMVLLPPETIDKIMKDKELSAEEKQIFAMHPFVAADLLKDIPRLEGVAQMVVYQEQRFDGNVGTQELKSGNDIPLGGRILKVALDFDLLSARGIEESKAINKLGHRTGYYDPQVIAALTEIVSGVKKPVSLEKDVELNDLTENMVFAQEVTTIEGVSLVPKGYRVSRILVSRLRNFQQTVGLRTPFRMIVQPED
ncbi:MAG: response regulator, partial [Syntrophobacterales bacterium]|nr:response regulator [Syntrophobacterales bacterium]